MANSINMKVTARPGRGLSLQGGFIQQAQTTWTLYASVRNVPETAPINP